MLADLRTRFEGFNEITKAFDCIYDVLTMSEATLIEKARALADLYGRPSGELISQLRLFRTVMKAKDKIFDSFAQMAKYILTRTKENAYSHLRLFVAIILVMPFVTADCERSFSAMNNIKTEERNKLGIILNELMLLYDMTPEEKATLDIKAFAEWVVGKWKYDKVDKKPWSESYDQCIV